MFRYKKSIPLPYARQGYIYFTSRGYLALAPEQRAAIRRLCREVGGPHEGALFEFVTTDATATAICMKHYIASTTTLYRLVRRYYMEFPDSL